jgi:hypothetical protein
MTPHFIENSFTMQLCLIAGLFTYSVFDGCAQNVGTNITVAPEHFKIQFRYEVDNTGIILNTSWGADKTTHKLYLDNDSPTWTNNNVIQNNKSVSKSKDFSYRTTVADGTFVHDDVYICDSISLGLVTFKNFGFYKISGETHAGKNEKIEGVLGENLLSKGIWKINFRSKIITFTSSIDSLGEMTNARLLPCKFTSKAIEVAVTLRNKTTRKFQLDLGFNGMMILPLREFTQIEIGNKGIYTDSSRFSSPSSFEVVENTHAFDTIKINRNYFLTTITTNKFIKETLIGRLFFERFEFLILDYINKSVYVSKNAFY